MMALVSEAPSRVPPTVAQQIFVIGSGIAGGAAGFYLAKELTQVEEVPVAPLAIATILSVFFTFGAAVYLVKHMSSAY